MPDVLTIPAESILTKVDPKCAKGDTYMYSIKKAKVPEKNYN